MTRLWTSASVMGALLLAACGDSEPRPSQPPANEAERPALTPEQALTNADWSLIASGEGVALRLEGQDDLIAGVACMRDPAGLRVETDRFRPIMSEDRFTVGVGGEAYALAADLQADRERGVEASGDIPADLLDRLAAGDEIAFNYGAQNLGPFPAVAPADRDAFVAGCREALG
jgi:hypothetical protein